MRGGKLTRHFVLSLRSPSLVSSRGGSYHFVECSQGYDAEEGEDEAGCCLDVPPAKDDAEIRGVPGEEHLQLVMD